MRSGELKQAWGVNLVRMTPIPVRREVSKGRSRTPFDTSGQSEKLPQPERDGVVRKHSPAFATLHARC
jgi:hypothetical protein